MSAVLVFAVPVSASAARPAVTSPIRIVVIPVKIKGGSIPSANGLREMIRRQDAWFRRASGGLVRVEGTVGPPFVAGAYEIAPGALSGEGRAAAFALATAAGLTAGDPIPVFVLQTPNTGQPSHASSRTATMVGQMWKEPKFVAHEIGHALGLAHARSPSCPRPFRPATCRDTGPGAYEYGDPFDAMGSGRGSFSATSQVALGWVAPTDAPPGSARVSLRPIDRPGPTALRLRAADRDWYVESRLTTVEDSTGRLRTLTVPRGVFVSRARPASSATLVDEEGIRIANAPQVRIPVGAKRQCPLRSGCLNVYLHRPGARLTVPGAFTLRVLAGTGAVRVQTTWLDRTPPIAGIASVAIRQVPGAPELELGVTSNAAGAGVLAMEVEQAGVVNRIAADDVNGLVDGAAGAGTVRVPLVAGASMVRVRLIDAAGNVSAPAEASLSAAASMPAATVTFSPALARDVDEVPLLPGGVLTFSGRTSPAVAGAAVMIERTIVAEVGPDGTFAGTFRPPYAGVYGVRLKVPVARAAIGFDYTNEVVVGLVRG